MSDEQKDEWSPAENPYAIAVSQSWWALQALLLFASESSGAVDHRQQIYARQIFGQLRLLRLCARMQADELERLGVSEVARDRLNQAIEDFDTATPDAMVARNMLEHFNEYARGNGALQKRAIREEGLSVYEAAAVYWGGGYDPTTEQITEGPIVIHVPTALAASEALHHAIYAAGKTVDAHRSDST
ncbi:MAG TPA: hypothetical protein VK781_02180 [Solirubrobacteraceae bacterium]|jgi:hypothetical protein|nr:hypothetical protein [Solirubrobacteraceae bacterium]